eukprot:TRINITY_DN10617_c0_g3_i1.p1 TRINITY_DN10617_c0_g3~~TRINITY_DN10617_c0_g3_i1.p1  ORF type:complete len:316 (-),score=38.62 TRINITY_DN10617_c0_g3_i1:721-1668(-)
MELTCSCSCPSSRVPLHHSWRTGTARVSSSLFISNRKSSISFSKFLSSRRPDSAVSSNSSVLSSEDPNIIIIDNVDKIPDTAVYYDSSGAFWKHAGSEGEDREVLVQQMLCSIDELSVVEELENKIAQGEDFGKLARKHSYCKSKHRDGILGWVRRGRYTHIPEFEDAVLNSPLKKVVRCKTNLGWHLVQVLDERRGILQAIEPDDLFPLMQDKKFVESAQLIDVRESFELELARVPGFKNLPFSLVEEWLWSSKVDVNKDTYVLCYEGKEAGKAAELIKSRGVLKVYYVLGGVQEYARVVYSRDPNLVLLPYQA